MGKQKEKVDFRFGWDPVRNQGMIEIGDMRYRRFFFIWVNFGSNLNHCVGGNWHLSDIQRAVLFYAFFGLCIWSGSIQNLE